MQQFIGGLGRVGIYIAVLGCRHHQMERLRHPGIAQMRLRPRDDDGTEMGRRARQFAQTRLVRLGARLVPFRDEQRSDERQRQGAIDAENGMAVVVNVTEAFVVTRPPARPVKTDLVAPVGKAEPIIGIWTGGGHLEQQ